jgi:hypothetical protein
MGTMGFDVLRASHPPMSINTIMGIKSFLKVIVASS